MNRPTVTKTSYSQIKAMLAITKASLRSTFRSPSAVVFSLVFPFIFIAVFGFIGGGGLKLDIAVNPGCDTTSGIYRGLAHNTAIHLIIGKSDTVIINELKKGTIDGAIFIKQGFPPEIHTMTSAASKENGTIFISMVNNILLRGMQAYALVDPEHTQSYPVLKQQEVSGRPYKRIDFILPGQLGFSLLSTGVFGTAFVLLNLRNALVIKRFFATPIRRSYIVLGEAISRVLFAMMGAVVILTVGYFCFGFTLVHGFVTFFEMLLLSLLGLIVFMGFGFAISGIAKNESTVPPLANLVTLPQFLLSGTFFSVSVFPIWLQRISNVLPLTYLNDAMRKVAFDGYSLLDPALLKDISVVLIWGVVIYALAIKVFKWE